MVRLVIAALVCAASPRLAEGFRVKAPSSLTESKTQDREVALGVSKKFECPDECQECCAASWSKNWIKSFGLSQTAFKCVLKTPFKKLGDAAQAELSLPKGRKCTSPKKKNYSPLQAKVECDYTEEEKGAKPWASRDMARCSQITKCCCPASEDWTEYTCLDVQTNGVSSSSVQMTSPSRHTEETFRQVPAAAQQYENKAKTCVNPTNAPLAYQLDAYSLKNKDGCCMKTETKTEKEKYLCNFDSDKEEWCYRDVHWEACVQFEKLYHCSTDGGLLQSGTRFKRVSAKAGICLGEETTSKRLAHTLYPGQAEPGHDFGNIYFLRLEGGKCPGGHSPIVAGEQCDCAVGCGR
jgi:hypothetical protein